MKTLPKAVTDVAIAIEMLSIGMGQRDPVNKLYSRPYERIYTNKTIFLFLSLFEDIQEIYLIRYYNNKLNI